MQALIEVSLWLESRLPFIRQMNLSQILQDQLTVLLVELSMFREAHNQIQLRRNFADSPLLYVPRLHAGFTRQNLLVMERIDAPSIGELARMQQAGVDFKVLAHKGVETFFTQVFDDNFFHADMHPGNVFVDISDRDPKWIALDCAIVGSLGASDQSYLAQNLIAFSLEIIARSLSSICDLAGCRLPPMLMPSRASFARFANLSSPNRWAKSFCRLHGRTARNRTRIWHASSAAAGFTAKTLLYVEGLGRQLYPQLNLWETAEPFMRRWAIRHLGPAAVIGKLLDNGPKLLAELHRLPELLDDNQTIELRKQLAIQQISIERLHDQVKNQHRRSKRLGWFAGSLLSALAITWWLS